MSEWHALTVVLGFRNREVERVGRCLASLQRQSFRDFKVIFVDYGSSREISQAVKIVVGQFDFCQYIYSETRGYPWNRSQALNVGGRLAQSNFLMTTDVDMVFPPSFLEKFMNEISEERMLYCYHHFLPPDFNDWNNLGNYIGRLPTATKAALGACQCVSTRVFKEIRGFDEYYKYWGVEDADIYQRLLAFGLQEKWLNEQTQMFHQWHPEVNDKTPYFMPAGLRGRMENHRLRHQKQIVRNSEDWGHIHTSDERIALSFIDVELNHLLQRNDLQLFDRRPNSNREAGNLVIKFWDMPSGHALAINYALYPNCSKSLDTLIRSVNKLLRTGGIKSRLDYEHNLLHSFLVEYIDDNPDLIADYFLGLPTMDGISVLVRA